MKTSTCLLLTCALAACSSSTKDLKSLCEAAREAELRSDLEPIARGAHFAKLADERLSSGTVRGVISNLAKVEPERRYALLRQAASDLGQPEWECPAIMRLLQPVVLPGNCAPWNEPTQLTVSSQAGRADFIRTFQYDFATGVLTVDDSDPFASADGVEAKEPRIIKKTKTLKGDEKGSFERGLRSICPSAQALAARCAPGGCARLEVVGKAGKSEVQDAATVKAVMGQFLPFFPDLRRQ